MKLHVHIERLILEDLPVGPALGPGIGSALKKELARLLATGGLRRELRTGATIPRLRAGELAVTGATPPPRLGQGIARAIHAGIGAPAPGRTKR